MDIKPPPKRRTPPYISEPQPRPAPVATPQPIPVKPLTIKRRLPIKWIIIGVGTLIILIVAALIGWYTWALQPLNASSTEKIRMTVEDGDTTSAIAKKLKDTHVVRSATAFRIYAELSRTKSKLQAGGYVVSPSQSVSDIINHLVSGKTDELTITIPPGITLEGIQKKLKEYGYSEQEITTALNAKYDSPLFADKPATANLEGYIFPETFNISSNASPQELLEKSFNELYSRLQTGGLLDKFKQHNLTIHQALTLASIIQMEESDPTDQKQVAQVFYLRLEKGMALESDPTFKYAAKLLGVEPSITIDSPYNTRKYAGLPPGPIANMNFSALEALAAPAPGDYLYFVAGDDGMTYFSHTLDEHIENIKKHCHDLCS